MNENENEFDWKKFKEDIRYQTEIDFKELSPEEYQMKYFGIWKPVKISCLLRAWSRREKGTMYEQA